MKRVSPEATRLAEASRRVDDLRLRLAAQQEDLYDAVIAAYSAGVPLAEMEERTGFAKSWIYVLLQRRGIAPGREDKRRTMSAVEAARL